MQKYSLLVCALLLSSCGGKTSVYNALGNIVGSVEIYADTAIIVDVEGKRLGSVEGNRIHNADGDVIGKALKREGLVLIEGDEAMGYLQDGTDCYDVAGYRQGRLGSVIDPEAAAGGCLLLILE